MLSSGCVAKKKYEELATEREDLLGRVDHLQAQAAGKDEGLRALQVDLSNTQAALAAANEKVALQAAKTGQLKENIERMQEALRELELRKAQSEASLAAYRELLDKFRAMIDAGTLRVRVASGRMVVEMATDILFPPGSATLSREGQGAIESVSEVLASIPNREYQVVGHTDDQPIYTERFPSNWHLGAARAIAVTRLLISSGLEPTRVSAASYAEHHPVDVNRTKEGRAQNRRIEIIVVPDLSQMPGYDELQGLSGTD